MTVRLYFPKEKTAYSVNLDPADMGPAAPQFKVIRKRKPNRGIVIYPSMEGEEDRAGSLK